MTSPERAYSAEQLGGMALDSLRQVMTAVGKIDMKRDSLIADARKLVAIARAASIDVPAELVPGRDWNVEPMKPVGNRPARTPSRLPGSAPLSPRTCPDCGSTFEHPQGLGQHRRWKKCSGVAS